MRRSAGRLAVTVVLAAASSALIGVGHADDADVAATITDDRIPESSGLVQSSRDPGLAYTVNDSGSGPVVYVLDLATGDVVGTATLADVELVDAEALAVGADRLLYVADIGDNQAERRSVDLYAIQQPGRGDVTVPAARHRLRYADGAHDAESLVSDAVDGSFHLITKGLFGGDVYRLGELRSGDDVTVARRVEDAAMPKLATDADVFADSAAAVVRSYGSAYIYALPQWQLVDSVKLPRQRQGETVAVIDGGPRFYVGTEGLPSPLHELSVAPDTWRELTRRAEGGSAQPPPSSGDAADDEDEEVEEDDGPARPGGRRRLVLLFVIGAVALVALARAALRRR
jgi:hypothetical protein